MDGQGCTAHLDTTTVGFPVSQTAIDFRAVLDAIDADQFLGGIIPVQDAKIAHAEFAQTRQVCRHPNKSPMHHDGGIFKEPLDFVFDACTDSGVQLRELRVGLGAYFDPVGHGMWRGFQALNLPARSSRRAARSSAMILGFCARSQSCNSSSVSTEESTGIGISTVSVFMPSNLD
jgi:hypothetical protein